MSMLQMLTRAEDPSSVDALVASPLGSADPGNSGNTDSFESIFIFDLILNPTSENVNY